MWFFETVIENESEIYLVGHHVGSTGSMEKYKDGTTEIDTRLDRRFYFKCKRVHNAGRLCNYLNGGNPFVDISSCKDWLMWAIEVGSVEEITLDTIFGTTP